MNAQRWMSKQFFTFYLTWGVFLPYWTGWMIHTKGVTVTEASLIMSIGLAARGLSTMAAFPLLSEKLSSKALLNFMSVATLAILFLYLPVNSFAGLLLVTLLFHLFYPSLMPALDSAAGFLLQSRQPFDYGKSRSWGSIGFVAAGMMLTFFTGAFGDGVIFWALLLSILLFVFLGFAKAPPVLSGKPGRDKLGKGGMLGLFKIRHFGLVLVIVILLQAAHASYYNYGYIFLQEIDAPKYWIGVILNIAVLAEIVFFSIADRVFRNFSVGSLLAVAALGSTVRWVAVAAFPSVIVFCIAQTLHALSFAMGHYAFMKYLAANIPPADISKAQGMYSALALSWSTAVLTVFGGFLYEIEPRYAFLGMIVCSVPSLLLALVYRKKARMESGTAV